MDQKKCLVALLVSLGLIIAGAVIGSMLESNGVLTEETIGAAGVTAVLLVYLGLFLVMVFALVPLVIRFFINGQARIGNSGLPVIQWLQQNEKKVVYGVWAFFFIGLCIALPAAVKGGLFK